MSYINVIGGQKIFKCLVRESMGYNHDVGGYVKAVMIDGIERIAVKRGRLWYFWSSSSRVAPLIEYIERSIEEERFKNA